MQFVLLYHAMPQGSDRRDHWDLMIEDPARAGSEDLDERRLWTWSIQELPPVMQQALAEYIPGSLLDKPAVAPEKGDMWSDKSGLAQEPQTTNCTRLEDHRAIYLTFEGEISGGRGQVRQIDGGECWLLESNADKKDSLEKIVARLKGTRHAGTIALQHFEGDRWQLSWSE